MIRFWGKENRMKVSSANRHKDRMEREPQCLEIDLAKIFLTPPGTMKERIFLFAMMVVVFTAFFGPVMFTAVSPMRGAVLSALPAFSVSWGFMVFFRSVFKKREFCKK